MLLMSVCLCLSLCACADLKEDEEKAEFFVTSGVKSRVMSELRKNYSYGDKKWPPEIKISIERKEDNTYYVTGEAIWEGENGDFYDKYKFNAEVGYDSKTRESIKKFDLESFGRTYY